MSKKPSRLSGARHAPGILICSLWCCITFVIFGYVIAASFSTTKDMFQGTVLQYQTGFHVENYVEAWTKQALYVCFVNSLVYAAVAVVGGVAMAAPATFIWNPATNTKSRTMFVTHAIPTNNNGSFEFPKPLKIQLIRL